MPDNVIISNEPLDDIPVSTDLAPSGQIERVKLAVSLDGGDAHIPADEANGLDVDVTRVLPGTTGPSLGKAEDAPHASGDVGVMSLAVRKDAGGTLAGTDGDYAPLQLDPSGALRVAATGLTGGIQFAEDAPHVSGDAGTMALAVRRDAGTTLSSADGDYTPLSTDPRGWLRVVGLSDLYGPTEYTTDDALPTNPTGPHIQTRKASTLAATAPADGDSQGLRTSTRGALWVALDSVSNPVGDLVAKRALVTVATAQTDSVVVAAVATKKIRVLQAFVVAADTAQPITFNSKGAGAGTAITPQIRNVANGGEVLPFSPMGWFETNTGEALTVTTPSGGSNTSIVIGYVEV